MQTLREFWETYRLAKHAGELAAQRTELTQVLRDGLYKKCRGQFPGLAWHSLWRLPDGSLALVIYEGEVLEMPDCLRFNFSGMHDRAVLAEAISGFIHIAPVSPVLQTRRDPAYLLSMADLPNVPSQVLRELRRVYRIKHQGSLLYAHPSKERRIPVSGLGEHLDMPEIEAWKFPRRERSPNPPDMV